MNLVEGHVIRADFLDGTATVKKFEKKAGYYLLEAVLTKTSEFKELRITDQQLALIQKVSEEISPMKDSEDFFFFIEANRIRLAYQFDPLLAVNVSQVDPLPHQIEAVYEYVLKNPKIRFLIADDAGAGKTIMAGLSIKELQYRKMAKRILIVAPGHLKYQWMREMKDKFRTNFTLISRQLMDESFWGENIWDEQDRCIASLDFLKQADILKTLKTSQWDLVIVDEAHKMSAYAYPSKEGPKIDRTQRYKVGEALSALTTHMIFLTATPHRGDDENFRLFLDLLRPGFFSKKELLQESVEKKENPIFVRRLKEDMKKFDGSPIFPPRHVTTVLFSLTSDERDLYNSVTKYVQNYFDMAKERRSIAFALMILQRRLTSSSYAILRSLERRKERLETLLELPERIKQDQDYERVKDLTEEDLEDLDEEERWDIEEKLEHLTIAKNVDEVKREIAVLEELVVKAKKVHEKEIESKLVKLRDEVLANLKGRKLLIFTEFKDTLDYLVSKIREWGYSVSTIHGNMNMDLRIVAEADFKHDSQIMVATEAAGEGINLQFCSLMVNYDIPWNPNRLEQRMGRIHRYGQDLEVNIYNMVTRDTREGQILDRLFEKLNLIREALGSDRVFDIIENVIPGGKLDELFKDAIFNQRRMEEIYEKVDIDEAVVREQIEKVSMTGLATRYINYSGMEKQVHTADENRLMPEYIEDYFLRVYGKLGGKEKKVDDYYRIESIPFDLRKYNEDYTFKSEYGKLLREYSKATFEKEVANKHFEYEFIAPGHPLLEAVNQKVLDEYADGNDAVAVFGDESNSKEGVLWFIEGVVNDGFGNIAGKRVFCLYHTTGGEINSVNPSILWDLKPLNGDGFEEGVGRIATRREEVEEFAINNVLFPYQNEIYEKRKKDIHIKKRYGLRSIDYLLQESNDRLLNYQEEEASGKDMRMPILNEERRKEDLESKREALEKEIKLEGQLMVSAPKILGAAIVLPMERVTVGEGAAPVDAGMSRDPEVEAIAMEKAMAHETENGWTSEDVSKENLGFDIRSIKFDSEGLLDDIRYIEVKGRAAVGGVRISSNEWKKARRFKNKFWLYIVTNAKSDSPELKRIQNPSEAFKLDVDIYATGYVIPFDKWKDA